MLRRGNTTPTPTYTARTYGAEIAGDGTCAACWDRRGRSRASEKDGGGGLFCGYLRGGHVLTMIVVCATNRDAGGIFAGCVRAR